MNPDFFERKSPLEVKLSAPGYSLRVDADPAHCSKEAPHWHLCFKGRPIARITNYGCWTSWPQVDRKIRIEAEAITKDYLPKIAAACGQYTVCPRSDIDHAVLCQKVASITE